FLALGNAPAEHRERFAEEGADEMGLKPARLRTFHLLADFADDMRVHALGGELALGNKLLDGADIDRAINLPEQLGLLFRPVAVTDCLDKEIAQGLPLKSSPSTS